MDTKRVINTKCFAFSFFFFIFEITVAENILFRFIILLRYFIKSYIILKTN